MFEEFKDRSLWAIPDEIDDKDLRELTFRQA